MGWRAHPNRISARRWMTLAVLAGLLVSSLIFAVSRDTKPAAAQGCAPGEHDHGGGLGCHSTSSPPHGSCPSGQHLETTADGNGHLTDCHSTSSPPHSCPEGEVSTSTTEHGHVSGCTSESCSDVHQHRHEGEDCHFAGARDCFDSEGHLITSVDHHAECPDEGTGTTIDCSSWAIVQHPGHTHTFVPHNDDTLGWICTYSHECGCTGVGCHVSTGEHRHTNLCHADHPPLPSGCVSGLYTHETVTTIGTDHGVSDGHGDVSVTQHGCEPCPAGTHNQPLGFHSACHAHPQPTCDSTLYQDESTTVVHTVHDASGHIEMSTVVAGCKARPTCGAGFHNAPYGYHSSCHADHAPPTCAPGRYQHESVEVSYTTHGSSAHGTATTTVSGCDPNPPPEDDDCTPVSGEHRHSTINVCHPNHPPPPAPDACSSGAFASQTETVTWIVHTGTDGHTTMSRDIPGCNPDPTPTATACSKHEHGGGLGWHCSDDGHSHATDEPECTSSNAGEVVTWIVPHYIEQEKTCPALPPPPTPVPTPVPQCVQGQQWDPELGRCTNIECPYGTLLDLQTGTCGYGVFGPSSPKPVVAYADKSLIPTWGMGTFNHDVGLHSEAPSEWSLQWRQKDTDDITPGDQPGLWTQVDNLVVTRECRWMSYGACYLYWYLGSYTVTGLVNGTVYELRVMSHSHLGPGVWGAITEGTPRGEPALASLTAVGGDALIDLSWVYPPTGAPVTGFDIRYRFKDANPNLAGLQPGVWQEFHQTGSGTTNTLTGLVNGEWYEAEVRGVNNIGDGPWSNTAEAQPTGLPSKMETPFGVGGDSIVYLRWEPPASDGGLRIERHEIEWKDATAATWSLATNTRPWAPGGWTTMNPIPSRDFSNLVNGTTYEFKVRACNINGCGDWSGIARVTPTAVWGNRELHCLSSYREVVFAWSGGLTSFYNHQVQRGTLYVSDVPGVTLRVPANSFGSFSANSLEHGSSISVDRSDSNTVRGAITYTYRRPFPAPGSTQTINTANEASCAALIPPGRPNMPTVVPGNRQLDVSWSAPSDTGSSPITDYDMRYRIKDTNPVQTGAQPGGWSDWPHTGTGTTATITGLVNGTTYEVQVRAENSAGEGPWSPSGEGTPLGSPTVTVQCYSNTQTVELDWSTDTGTGTMEVEADQTLTWTYRPDGLGASASVLTADWPPTGIRARRVRSGYQSPWTTAVDCVDFLAPALTATGGIKEVSLSWTAPTQTGGLPITHWSVLYREQGVSSWTILSPNPSAGARSAVITGLANGTTYETRVAAVNSLETGKWAFANATTLDVPGAPAAPTLTPSDMALDASWTAPSNNGGSAITDYDVEYRIKDTDLVMAGDQPGTWTDDPTPGPRQPPTSPAWSTAPPTRCKFGPSTLSAMGLGLRRGRELRSSVSRASVTTKTSKWSWNGACHQVRQATRFDPTTPALGWWTAPMEQRNSSWPIGAPRAARTFRSASCLAVVGPQE